jgi:hypothetical protein
VRRRGPPANDAGRRPRGPPRGRKHRRIAALHPPACDPRRARVVGMPARRRLAVRHPARDAGTVSRGAVATAPDGAARGPRTRAGHDPERDECAHFPRAGVASPCAGSARVGGPRPGRQARVPDPVRVVARGPVAAPGRRGPAAIRGRWAAAGNSPRPSGPCPAVAGRVAAPGPRDLAAPIARRDVHSAGLCRALPRSPANSARGRFLGSRSPAGLRPRERTRSREVQARRPSGVCGSAATASEVGPPVAAVMAARVLAFATAAVDGQGASASPMAAPATRRRIGRPWRSPRNPAGKEPDAAGLTREPPDLLFARQLRESILGRLIGHCRPARLTWLGCRG